jgi:glycosyltransferase involved in cell wall biosynthesis
MAKLSIVLPAREEPLLQQTIRDLLAHAHGDVEIIPVLDGWTPEPPLIDDPRVKWMGWGDPHGLRPAINAGMAAATGDWLMKIDAHCAISDGYDVALQAVCDQDWIVVPEKYSLHAETWTRYREPWQYFYLTFPWDPTLNTPGLHDKACGKDVNRAHADTRVDDILSYQGSCWFLSKAHWNRIGPMDGAHYYTAQEPQELGLATWLAGGRVKVCKDVWYAHLWKGRGHRRGFAKYKSLWNNALLWSAEHWMAQPGFPALVEQFWPVLKDCEYGPWPEDWDNPARKAAVCR